MAITGITATKGQINGGNRRLHAAKMTVGANADTYTVPNMKKIDAVNVTSPSTSHPIGCTVATNVVTFSTDGTSIAVQLFAEGI